MKRGFTLIELMVVIGVIVILTVGSITGLVLTSKRQQVKATAQRLQYIIASAFSQAQNPSDDVFGLTGIEVDIYPYDSNDTNMQNKVRVYYCTSIDYDVDSVNGNKQCPNNQKTEIKSLSFDAPKGVYFNAANKPSGGNVQFVKPPPPATIKTYYFFSILAVPYYKSNPSYHIGQIPNATNEQADPGVYFSITNSPTIYEDTEKYRVWADIRSGLVTMDQMLSIDT